MINWTFLTPLNKLLSIGIGGLLVSYFLFALMSSDEVPTLHTKGKAVILSSFAPNEEESEKIYSHLLHLKHPPFQLEIPNLSQLIFYWGTNERPDRPTKTQGAISWKNTKESQLFTENAPLFLAPGKDKKPYEFSAENKKTPLWIVITPEKDHAQVKTFMRQELSEGKDPIIHEKQFSLKKRDGFRFLSQNWKLGEQRVDGSLLIRQQAKWAGQDLFLKNHGGEEFIDEAEREKLNFDASPDQYSVFAKGEEGFIWHEERWQEWRLISQEVETKQLPMLQISKIDERIMKLRLWAPEGKFFFPLTLIKTPSPWNPELLIKKFKFLGVRSKQAWILEINGDRVIIRPKEWLLKRGNSWEVLETTEEIDDYVDGRLSGELLVLEKISRKEGKQVLEALLYNTTRSVVHSFSLSLEAPKAPTISPKG